MERVFGRWALGVMPVMIVGWAAASPGNGDRYLSYSGTATARHATQFLYGEHHVLRYREGRLAERVVLYSCQDGSAFARKTVDYVDPLAPNFLLEDASNGMRQGVRGDGSGRTVFFRGDRFQMEKAGPLPSTQALVADAGFDEFVRANWSQLNDGKPVALHFLIPGRLQELKFQAQRVRSDRVEGIPVEVMQLKPAGVLGWLLPAIDVSYSAQEHVLVRYEGVTDLRDASGNNYQARISFPGAQRVPGGEREISAAREAHLSACK